MLIDPGNPVFGLCIKGMEAEAHAQPAEAHILFEQAWQIASTDLERSTAAHYVARQQDTVAHKLTWDETALEFAMKVKDEDIKGFLPSLHLNIAKCHEDSGNFEKARGHYELALSFSSHLQDDGYGRLILSGARNGLERLAKQDQ